MKFYWLRYPQDRKTGFEVRFLGGKLCAGLRWSSRAYNVRRKGPFVCYHPKGRSWDWATGPLLLLERLFPERKSRHDRLAILPLRGSRDRLGRSRP